MADSDKPRMNWQVADLNKEWKLFRQHSDFTCKAPLDGKTQIEKVNYLMTFKSMKHLPSTVENRNKQKSLKIS